MRLIATAVGTGGRYAVIEQVTPPGWGPPRHIHSREDEIFYILDGSYELHVGDERRTVSAGASAILSNLLLVVLSRSGRWFYLASLLMLILFVILYNLLSKPINRIQTEAAKTGANLGNGRELQASWDSVLWIRVPLLVVSLLAQSLALLVASA